MTDLTLEIDAKCSKKIQFIFNAVANGWMVEKVALKTFVFTKEHYGNTHFFEKDDFLEKFVRQNA